MADNRFANFKNRSFADQEGRRHRRQDDGVQLRKSKRNEQVLKKRNLSGRAAPVSPTSGGFGGRMSGYSPGALGPDGMPRSAPTYYQDGSGFDVESVPPVVDEKLDALLTEYTEGVMSEDLQLQSVSTMNFRKILSKERDPPIQAVIDCGVIPTMVSFLEMHEVPLLQFEAAWALTNIASGNAAQTNHVIQANAIPIFIDLLESRTDDVKEQAVWALGNIAGDGPRCRDLVLESGILDPLLRVLKEAYKVDGKHKISMLRNATWTLSNLCRGKSPPPNFETVAVSLNVLAALIYSPDEEVLIDACWALSYLSDGSNANIQAVIGAGVCRRLVELLRHPNPGVVTPALRTIGNIVTGNDIQTQVVLNCEILPCLKHLLRHDKEAIRKETCWTISNITAGNRDQIQHVIDSDMLIPIIDVLASAEFKTRKEAAWAISNATSGGTVDQIREIMHSGAIPPLCDILAVKDTKVIEITLDAIFSMLQVAEEMGDGDECREEIEKCDGLAKIEQLQGHPTPKIYDKVQDILTRFFMEDEDDLTDQGVTGDQFQLNATGFGDTGGYHF
eukprot:CAMPEP_0182926124 /NCGR_PEP_ID=MMETSP0105_2-20130417/10857_1 /TAXON_ID=81532 ORGANISM="Acanthoeca-like sp., Strain 10tr" /NCGR_SAMPLE_ID=MMETSP0105_2 /ASSEMBLY_ACC=CAM_ASM_000205 /LENGTH=560 /DNA_ID=CAMNT_0025063997 /DNA_START=55 /DNA_END=1737 /DNA_ORIENTATION=+